MPQSGHGISLSTKLVATAVAMTVAIGVCATAATVIVASDVSGRKPARSGANAVPASFLPGLQGIEAVRALIDTLVQPLGPMRPADLHDVQLITALANTRGQPHTVWNAAPKTQFPGLLPNSHSITFPIRFAPDSLNARIAEELAADTATAWVGVFRRFARSEPLPPLWGYKHGMPGVPSAFEVPFRGFVGVRSLFLANEGASLLALRAGNSRLAMEHARENLSASRHLLEQPLVLDALIGRREVRRGAQLLAIAAAQARDTATQNAALRLDAQASRLDGFSLATSWLVEQEANPRAKAAIGISADRSLHPAIRLAAMGTIAMGGCRSTPEVLFGFDPVRRESLKSAASAVSDLPRANELAELYDKLFTEIIDDPVALSQRLGVGKEKIAALGALGWIVGSGVRARAAICSAYVH